MDLTAGDRVQMRRNRGVQRNGVVTIGMITHQITELPPGYYCRVRWDGNTFSDVVPVEDLKKLKIKEKDRES